MGPAAKRATGVSNKLCLCSRVEYRCLFSWRKHQNLAKIFWKKFLGAESMLVFQTVSALNWTALGPIITANNVNIDTDKNQSMRQSTIQNQRREQQSYHGVQKQYLCHTKNMRIFVVFLCCNSVITIKKKRKGKKALPKWWSARPTSLYKQSAVRGQAYILPSQ